MTVPSSVAKVTSPGDEMPGRSKTTMSTMTDVQITTLARLAFHASKKATGDDGAAFEAANEVIKARASGPGFFDQESLTWSTREAQGVTVDNVTQEEIRAFRRESRERGDNRMADICGMALDDGDPERIAQVVAAIRKAND